MRKISLALTICLLGLIGLPANAEKKLEDNIRTRKKSDLSDDADKFNTRKTKATKPAPTISGAFGFTLGSFFDTKAPGVTFDEETESYTVKPSKPYRKWFNYSVKVTPISGKIYSISTFFGTKDKVAFNAEKEVVLSLLKDKYSDDKQQFTESDKSELFHYMDSSSRIVYLSIKETDDGINLLKLTYADGNLADCAAKEKLKKNKAKDGDSL